MTKEANVIDVGLLQTLPPTLPIGTDGSLASKNGPRLKVLGESGQGRLGQVPKRHDTEAPWVDEASSLKEPTIWIFRDGRCARFV